MASTINASTGPVSGLISTGDNSGQIELQANGVTKMTVSSSGVAIPTLVGANINLATNVTGTLPVANGGTGATSLTANNVLLGNGTSSLQAVAPGASGNVLTSNGSTWTSATPAASGSYTFTAATSITAGQAVSLDSSGQVKAAGVDPAILGSAVGYSGFSPFVGYDSVNSRYVIVYMNGTTVYAVAATITNGVLSLGTPVTVTTNVYQIYSLSHDTVQNVFLVAWTTSGNYYARATAFSLSGSTISVGSTVNVFNATCYWFSVVYAPGKQCHACFYSDDSVNPSRAYVTTIYTTGISPIAKTGNSDIGINYPQGGSLTWFPEADKAVYFIRWAQVGQNSYRGAITITGTGASSSASNSLSTYDDYRYGQNGGTFYDPLSQSVIYTIYTPTGYSAIVANSSLTVTSTITWPSTYFPYSTRTANSKIVTIGTQSYLYGYTADPYYPALFPFSITNGTLSFGLPSVVQSVTNGYIAGIIVGVSPQCIYVQSANNNAYPYSPAASNISSFIGISQNTVSSTQTTTVNILGGVNTNVTGLTTNTTYYLDNSGALTSSSSTGVKVGRALSATSLLVTGGQG